MSYFLHTDIGHDPDDAIALAYLIEHDFFPGTISIYPGHKQQIEIVEFFFETYDWPEPVEVVVSSKIEFNPNFNIGKHKVISKECKIGQFYPLDIAEYDLYVADSALILGPAKNIGTRLSCDELFFQGGYSPNSVKPLEKFVGRNSVQSYNPNGAKEDFDLILTDEYIKTRYYIGKNVCHGFTLKDLKWIPENPDIRKFYDLLSPDKAMHDVLATILMMNPDEGIWEQAKPFWCDRQMTTIPTLEPIYSLIGLKE